MKYLPGTAEVAPKKTETTGSQDGQMRHPCRRKTLPVLALLLTLPPKATSSSPPLPSLRLLEVVIVLRPFLNEFWFLSCVLLLPELAVSTNSCNHSEPPLDTLGSQLVATETASVRNLVLSSLGLSSVADKKGNDRIQNTAD
jgi:hypothetical protein